MFNRISQIELIKNLVNDKNNIPSSEKILRYNLCLVCKKTFISYLESSYEKIQSITRSYLLELNRITLTYQSNNDNDNNNNNNNNNNELKSQLNCLKEKETDLSSKLKDLDDNINKSIISNTLNTNQMNNEMKEEQYLLHVSNKKDEEQHNLLSILYNTNHEIHQLYNIMSNNNRPIISNVYLLNGYQLQLCDLNWGLIGTIIMYKRRKQLLEKIIDNNQIDCISKNITISNIQMKSIMRLIPLRKRLLIIISYYNINNFKDNLPVFQETLSLNDNNSNSVNYKRGLIALHYFLYQTKYEINIDIEKLDKYAKVIYSYFYKNSNNNNDDDDDDDDDDDNDNDNNNELLNDYCNSDLLKEEILYIVQNL